MVHCIHTTMFLQRSLVSVKQPECREQRFLNWYKDRSVFGWWNGSVGKMVNSWMVCIYIGHSTRKIGEPGASFANIR